MFHTNLHDARLGADYIFKASNAMFHYILDKGKIPLSLGERRPIEEKIDGYATIFGSRIEPGKA